MGLKKKDNNDLCRQDSKGTVGDRAQGIPGKTKKRSSQSSPDKLGWARKACKMAARRHAKVRTRDTECVFVISNLQPLNPQKGSG